MGTQMDRWIHVNHTNRDMPTTLIFTHNIIVVATNYPTNKWVEAKATVKNKARTIAKFFYEYVFTRYGLPIELASNQGKVIEYLMGELRVIDHKSAPYHPRANGQAESTNKVFCTALTKIVARRDHGGGILGAEAT